VIVPIIYDFSKKSANSVGFLPLSTTSPRGWFIPLSPVILTDRYLEWSVYTLCAQVNFEEIVSKQTVINVRVEEDIKNKASKIIADCGLTTSAAIRLFLMRVVAEGTLHFDQFFKPNAETIAALENLDYTGEPMSLAEFMAEIQRWKNEPDDDAPVKRSKAKRNAKG
jgi:DNA-damage-inducible protein J